MINAIIGKINKFLNDYILVESFGIEWKILMSTYSIEILKKIERSKQCVYRLLFTQF